jgi:pimeloyl-ACP methyl ester carboxylesterase
MVKLTEKLSRPGAEVWFSDSGGPGPAVVLTHGAGMDHSTFETQADALQAAGFRTILWDQRGHGSSALDPNVRFTATDTLDDLTALLETLALDQPVLVGHSLGGNLSQAYVRRYPERVGGLIVVGSTWNNGPLSGIERFGLRVGTPILKLIPGTKLPGLMARASAVSPDAIREIESMFSGMPKGVFLDVWGATVSLVEPNPVYRTPTPVPLGLIRGSEDATGNISTAMPRWANAEGISEQVIQNAGHVVMLDAPHATSRAILSVLEGWNFDPTGSKGRGSKGRDQ